MAFGHGGSMTTASTTFVCPTRYVTAAAAGGAANEDPEGSLVIATAMVLKRLRVRIAGPTAASNSVLLTVRVDGVDTALTVTWDDGTGAGAQTLSATADVAVAAGSRVSVSCVKTGANGANTQYTAQLEYALA